ncbi:MAG: ABC transporter substrate-binding protein [Treponema sp.]|jgi:putative aldouronate transport system substrate-binding protein|nr:ABC transporter substrate-binding protein [Treponema sp.]
MERIMKRAVVLLCAAVLGCSPAGNKQAAELYRVKWYGILDNPAAIAEDMKIVSKYAEDKIGVGIDFAVAPEGGINSLIQIGEPMDLLHTSGGEYLRWAELGALWDMTEAVKTVTPALWKSMPEVVWSGGTYKGKITAIPIYKDIARTEFILWDKGYIDKYNLQDAIQDQSLDGYEKIFKTIKDGEGARFYPASVSRGKTFSQPDAPLWDSGAQDIPGVEFRWDDPQLKFVFNLDGLVPVETIRRVNAWHKAGYFAPDQATNSNAVRPAVLEYGSGWKGAAPIWAGWNNNEYGIYPVERADGPLIYTNTVRGAMTSIGVNSKHQEEALKIMELLGTDPLFRDMICYGIEGKHFTYVKRPSGQQGGVVRQNPDTPWPLAAWNSGAWFVDTAGGPINVLSAMDSDPDRYAQIAEQNARARVSPAMGFTLDASPVAAEVNAVRAVWEKYRYDVWGGSYDDPQKIHDQIGGEMNAAGMGRILDEANRQMAAWRAENNK